MAKASIEGRGAQSGGLVRGCPVWAQVSCAALGSNLVRTTPRAIPRAVLRQTTLRLRCMTYPLHLAPPRRPRQRGRSNFFGKRREGQGHGSMYCVTPLAKTKSMTQIRRGIRAWRTQCLGIHAVGAQTPQCSVRSWYRQARWALSTRRWGQGGPAFQQNTKEGLGTALGRIRRAPRAQPPAGG